MADARREQVLQIVFEALENLNLELDEADRVVIGPTTPLFGPEAALDSLSLVSVIVDVETALTVHVYSPPLGRAGAYELSRDGTLRRHSVAADEELRASETFQEHRAIEDPPPGALESVEV